MKKITASLFCLLIATTAPSPATPPNAIETLRERMDSIVTIRGQTFNLSSVPETQIGIDPRTGGILARTSRPLQYQERKGAGVIISSDGRIVTNTHILYGSQRVQVTLRDGTVKEANILFISKEDDFSIIKIDIGRPLPAVEFADSQLVRLGDEVATIGHSDLLNGTISGGVISGLATRDTDKGTEIELLKLNINHYSGDSGGPVFDREGRFVGLMSAKGINVQRQLLAVPSNKIHFADISLDNPAKNQ